MSVTDVPHDAPDGVTPGVGAVPKRDGAPAAGRLRDLVASYRGHEGSPRWHSQWAWDNYEGLVVDLAGRLGLRRVCEIGGGRDPMFDRAGADRAGIELVVNDIDAGELALTPPGLATARFDVAGDLAELRGAAGLYDMMVSRMVFEHIAGVPRAWTNIHRLLRPGGVGLAFFPTLYAWPFLVNHLIPERASRRIVQGLFPNRADDGGDPKFPAHYDHCVGSSRRQERMLAPIGFREVHVMPFWGHGYLDRVPVARTLDAWLNRGAAALDLRLVTTYAFVLVRR